ncbi:MAG: carbohydrate kinase family protein [Desulfurococcaceae archaeon]
MNKSIDALIVGGFVVDNILVIENMPIPGKCLYARDFKVLVGGSANFAITASRLGLKTALLDAVGLDDTGKMALNILREENVDVSFTISRNGLTKRVLLLITIKGERSFINLVRGSATISPNDVDEEVVKRSKSIYVTGFSLGIDEIASSEGEAVLKAIETANKHGKIVFFDPGPFVGSIDPKTLDKVLERTDILSMNLQEAVILAGEDRPEDIVTRLHGKGPWVIAVKMGENGCFLLVKGKYYRQPSIKVPVIDTTGAGDAFNAALLYGFLRGLSPYMVIKLANIVGALAATKLGAGQNLPRKQEIVSFLEKLNEGELLRTL